MLCCTGAEKEETQKQSREAKERKGKGRRKKREVTHQGWAGKAGARHKQNDVGDQMTRDHLGREYIYIAAIILIKVV